ncbi:MAG: glutamine synthetase family protein [Planctomycetaceae bacterium]|nr:glutamine synthetase family protein [Planctomycetaceae bacterium]
MNTTTDEVLEFVQENDVQFIRLSFCDLLGFHKNIAIVADELPAAFANGISFDAHAIKGFRDVMQSDLLLFPDPDTMMLLPWRPGPGRVVRFYCDIRNPDKTTFPCDGRALLKQVVERCQKLGYICNVGTKCEFYLFKTNENGEPTNVTLDKGGYLDISPLDKGENIRREICLTLKEMGIKPESSHHEQGPGQNEIDFKPSNILAAADNLQTFKSVVKAVAARNGLFASFMPKPLPGAAGSGLHVNLSLAQNGINVFRNQNGGLSKIAENFIAGILARTPEMTLFLNPLANSYRRFGEFEAPKYISWSHQNRSQLIRIPAAVGEKVRLELRSPDSSLHPYLAFGLILAAGLDGIESQRALPDAVDVDLYTADENITKTLIPLPDALDKAIVLAENSSFVREVVGEELLMKYITLKKAEAAAFAAAEDKAQFDREQYFGVV